MTASIDDIAGKLVANVNSLSALLKESRTAPPSFEAGQVFDPSQLAPNAEHARCEAITQCRELIDLLQGTSMCLRPCYNATSLHAIYKFRIAEHVPVDADISFAQLAKRCGLFEADLRRIVRFAIVYHRVFKEPREGYVAHSAASLLLARSPDTQDAIGLMFDDFYPSFAKTVEAMETLKSQRPDATGWALAHDSTSDANTFAYLARHPDRATRFGNAMRFFTASVPGNSPHYLVEGYPWADVLRGQPRRQIEDGVGVDARQDIVAQDGSARPISTVVDVGGSTGYISFLIARATPPDVHVIVQDIHVGDVEGAGGSSASAVPSDLRDRVRFERHDFFTAQPRRDVDVYLLRWVLHDWPDEEATRILRMLVPGLKRGSRVLINDYVAPGAVGAIPAVAERYVRELDMIMLSAFNSYERDMADWSRIVAAADPRFGRLRLHPTQGESLFKILETVWEGDDQ